MHFTRRPLDLRSFIDHRASAVLLLLTGVVASSAVTSCSSDEDGDASGPTLEPLDGGAEAAADGGPTDAEARDAHVTRDAASSFDGGPLPVVCVSPPCATALVTTIPLSASDRGEGYCALLDDGTVACWGANGAGQLGRGADAGTLDDSTPMRVVGVADIVQLDHTCALDDHGDIWCWGTGPFLRDDGGSLSRELTPIKLPLPPAARVAVGAEVACASVADAVLCWGQNTNAQLAPLATTPASEVLPPRPMALPNGAPVRALFVSSASLVLREDGALVSWGANPPLARVSSLNPDPNPMPIAIADVSSVDLTPTSACATVGGVGYCWGSVIGGSTPLDYALPEPIVAPEPLVQVATTTGRKNTDGTVQPQRWCGVGASGAVYCWGYNASGQAGDGTKRHAYEAVEVQGLPTTASQVKTMPDSTCALLTNGKVYCWGANYFGQLGNGAFRVPNIVPKEVLLP